MAGLVPPSPLYLPCPLGAKIQDVMRIQRVVTYPGCSIMWYHLMSLQMFWVFPLPLWLWLSLWIRSAVIQDVPTPPSSPTADIAPSIAEHGIRSLMIGGTITMALSSCVSTPAVTTVARLVDVTAISSRASRRDTFPIKRPYTFPRLGTKSFLARPAFSRQKQGGS